MSTLWQEEEFKQICSRELLTEKAANIEKTIVVKEREKARYAFDPTMFYENRFWNRRPDGIMINKYHRTLYILEFRKTRLTSNTEASSRRSERLPQNGRLNRSILWQGGVVQ